MADNQHILGERGKTLEDEFFRKEDARLIEKLRELKAKEATREELSRISGIKSTAILDRLIQLGVHAETLVALSIVPLAEVAWADGAIDAKEEQAILDRAAKSGVTPGSVSYDLLKAGWSAGPSRDSSQHGSTWSRASTRICPPSRSRRSARVSSSVPGRWPAPAAVCSEWARSRAQRRR